MVCNLERLAIARVDPDEALGIRNELVTACRHFTKKFFIKPKKVFTVFAILVRTVAGIDLLIEGLPTPRLGLLNLGPLT